MAQNPVARQRFLEEVARCSSQGIGLNPADIDLAKLDLSAQQCGQFARYMIGSGVIFRDKQGLLWLNKQSPDMKKDESVLPVRDISNVFGFMGQHVRVVREGELILPEGAKLWQTVEIQLPAVRVEKALLWVGNDPDKGPWLQLPLLTPSLIRLDSEAPVFEAFMLRNFSHLKVGIKNPGEKDSYQVIALTEDVKVFIARLMGNRSE